MIFFFPISFSLRSDELSWLRVSRSSKLNFQQGRRFKIRRHIRDLCIHFPATTVRDRFRHLKQRSRKLVNWPYNKQSRGDGLPTCQSAWCTHVSKTDRGNPPTRERFFKYTRNSTPARLPFVRLSCFVTETKRFRNDPEYSGFVSG